MGMSERRGDSRRGENGVSSAPDGADLGRIRIPTACAVGCPVTVTRTLEGPGAGMSAGAAGEIARATRGAVTKGTPAAR
jgi:hypothetical protein